jgi:hypothetical protein
MKIRNIEYITKIHLFTSLPTLIKSSLTLSILVKKNNFKTSTVPCWISIKHFDYEQKI